MKVKFLFILLFLSGIFAQAITVTSPNSGERWLTGTTKNITWTTTGVVGNVKIEYSSDGTTWTELVASTPNNDDAVSPGNGNGSYSWNNISLLPMTTYRIKISKVGDNTINDESNSTFSIVSIKLNSPDGGEKWQAGAQQNITWSASSGITSVKLEYHNGTAWTDITTVAASPNNFLWTIPNAPSNQIKVRVSDSIDPTINDESDANFTIVSLALSLPNGGNYLQVGKTTTIQWNSSAYINNVKLEYSIDNGANWTNIAASLPVAPNTYAWTIPNTPSTGCRVKVSDVANSSIYDISDAAFTISSITLTSPNGGERFLTGSTKQITWVSQNIINMRIEYSADNGANYALITASTLASNGTYNWTVPATTTQGLIKISDADHPTTEDASNGVFTISDLSLTAPTGASVWRGGSSQNITWTSTNITQIKLDYSTDNGVSWIPIAANILAGSSPYNWTLPNTPSLLSMVRISDQAFQDNFKISPAFELEPIPAITVTSPNGTENWLENTTHPITWTATYNIANVKIELSSDGGTTYPLELNPSIAANTGSWNWAIPNTVVSNNHKIRVSNVLDASVNDVSNNIFTVSRLILDPMNGGNKVQGGKSYNITWTAVNITNVKLEYTLNGTDWNVITNSVAASPASYSWTVPNTASTLAQIRISDASNSSIITTGALFTIATMTVVSPNGGESLLANTVQAITWTSQNITNIKIEYSTDGGTSWVASAITNSTAAVAGTFNWTTPATYLSTYRIRISDAADANIFDISDNNFTVSLLELTSPTALNINWKVGETRNITWNASPTVTNVKLDYSINNGGTWINIVPSIVASGGTYSWLVPNAPSANCKVRVSNVANPDNKSESVNVFTISKSLDLIAPDGGEEWEVGSVKSISWTRDIAVTRIRIEYSTDGGTSWTAIDNYVDAALLTYNWTIPASLSNNCKVRITDVNNSGNNDISNNTFKIVANPSIRITRPDVAGLTFETGASEEITWTSTNVQTVKIEYSTNNGASWVLIKSNEPSDGSYFWSVPNAVSTQCKIRITSETNSNIFDISDNKFTINPRITITSPNGGENIPVGNNHNITWASSNTANIKIEYSTDNGTSWNTIIASTAAAAGTYTWTTPNIPSTQCLIKISDAVKPEIYDLSDNLFTISSKILLTRPNGGESWQSGSIQDINWTSNNVTNVALHYSLDGGITWIQIIASVAASSGSYKWTIPSNINGNKVKIKVSDASNNSIYDSSDNLFIISNLALTKPNGSENYAIGSTQTITWTSSQISNVKLEYSIDNETSWQVIAASVPSSGLYYWEIPKTPSSQCKVRISEVGNPLTLDRSDNLFTISESPYVKVTYPNTKLNLVIGKTEIIKWNSNYVGDVKIDYSINGGISWTSIINSVPSTGSYNWIVPNSPSEQCRIRISDILRPSVFDDSDSNFTISRNPKLIITYPNGGEKLVAKNIYQVKWTSENIDSVKIEYSIDNGINWILVKKSAPSTGVYDWLVPSVSSVNCKIKLTDVKQSANYDVSDLPFEISSLPKIDLLSPDKGENFRGGNSTVIRWTSENIDKIKIEYSTNNGAKWNLIDNNVESSGQYIWNIPKIASLQCLIKISDASNPGIFDISATIFTISVLDLLTPTDNETLLSGDKKEITWKSDGVNVVKLEYSVNEGKTWTAISNSINTTTDRFNWTVPDFGLSQCQIRIYDIEKPTVRDSTKTFFTIKQIIVIQPTENETWYPASDQRIQWRSYRISNVKLEYSINNGGNWSLIRTSIPASTNFYDWKVPNTPSKYCNVRVSDAINLKVYDISKNTFTIADPVDVVDEPEIPSVFKLHQNYPNPFNPSTTINYSLPEASYVTLKIYDIIGNEVAVLINEDKNAGNHSVIFDASKFTSGIYIYQIKAGRFSDSKKLILIK